MPNPNPNPISNPNPNPNLNSIHNSSPNSDVTYANPYIRRSAFYHSPNTADIYAAFKNA